MSKVESDLTTILGEKPGIVLLVFTADDAATANYISNCRRDDTISALLSTGLRLKSDRKL